VHGWHHRLLVRRAPREVRGDLRRAHGLVGDIAGSPPRWYRPPYGVASTVGCAPPGAGDESGALDGLGAGLDQPGHPRLGPPLGAPRPAGRGHGAASRRGHLLGARIVVGHRQRPSRPATDRGGVRPADRPPGEHGTALTQL
jgi:peptidoglycan/xylan/chitin deacetylase (PgdA/CDA1 family)